MSPAGRPSWQSVRTWLLLAIPLVVGAGLRLHGLDWGLPDLFEEATPFFRAWAMWRWGESVGFDADPQFYRYPSLTFYAQALGQALHVAGAWLQGGAEAAGDVPVEFLGDRTALLYTGRAITAVFGLALILGTTLLGRRVGGRRVGLLAGMLVAVSPVAVDHAQMIETDTPLAAFVAWGLWACLRAGERPSWRRSAVAGALVGLAASAKYPGALLIVPLLAAHVRRGEARSAFSRIAVAAGAAAAAFAVTSPYILANLGAAWQSVAFERQHMERGHFGQGAGSSWLFYGESIGRRLLGLSAAAATVAGVAIATIARRRRWALVAGSFLVVYLATIFGWRMQADRYALPALPALAVFAAWLPAAYGRTRRFVPFAVIGLALLAPAALGLGHVYERTRPDTRTLAREWIEMNCPEGAFLVMEAWGPDLLEPVDLWALDSVTRRRVAQGPHRPLYAVQNLPTYQVMPEMSEAFYDPEIHLDVDFFVLSSDVGDRYRKDPDRFARQLAFYEALETRTQPVAEFGPEDGPGPRITIRFQPQRVPFARRPPPEGPFPLREGLRRPPPGEAYWFRSLGLNYETFGFAEAALRAYRLSTDGGEAMPGHAPRVAIGVDRCLTRLGREHLLPAELRRIAENCVDPRDRERVQEMARRAP